MSGGAYGRYYSAPVQRKSLTLWSQFSKISPETKRTVISIVLLALGVFMLLSHFGLAGKAGAFLYHYTRLAFGFGRWYVPLVLILTGFFFMTPSKKAISGIVALGAAFFVFSANGLVHLLKYSDTIFEAAQVGYGGGYAGLVLSYPLYKISGLYGGAIILGALLLVSFFLFFNASFQNIFLVVKKLSLLSGLFFGRQKKDTAQVQPIPPAPKDVEVEFSSHQIPVDYEKDEEKEAEAHGENPEETRQAELHSHKKKFPKIDIPIDLLDSSSHKPRGGDIEANQQIILKTLVNFNIPVEMGEVSVGPTVTQYTMKPAEGIKLSKIIGLGDNLALALAAHPIRIEAPIPGKSLVGVEVPNKVSAVVTLRSMIESPEFQARKSSVMVSIGKDVKGTPWFGDISRMPHMLIAGSTGSGKSVCINSMIVSLLYQNSPEDLKFIFVDPKRVELPVYNGIPHLLTPVITDVKKTVYALRWTLVEMERRFDKLSRFHKRDIQSYNRDIDEKMPYIIFVIDELADLMAAAGPEIEGLIIRLAQMARAVGIHLILATQRPSVDVITGLIKANITTRIAFSVASAVDSRTILDTSGAEKLLGRGDMLYMTSELSKPKRLQGAFASESEIKRVIDFLKKQAEPEYVDEIVEKSDTSPEVNFGDMSGDGDSLLPEAKTVIMQAGRASASLLQRRLKIGYARAARILDLLEQQGMIGPGDGAKPREILVQHSAEIGENSDDIEEEQH